MLSSDRWNLKEENGMMNCIARQDKKERESQKTEDLSRKKFNAKQNGVSCGVPSRRFSS